MTPAFPDLQLTTPSVELVESYAQALESGLDGPAGRPADLFRMRDDPAAFIADLVHPPYDQVTMPDGEVVPRVPGRELWAVSQGRFIGRLSLRERLNHILERFGGHIGYGVAPPFRNKGAATEMLRQALILCRDQVGLERVLLTCDDANLASARVIEKNGGVLQDRVPHPYALGQTRRYWITL